MRRAQSILTSRKRGAVVASTSAAPFSLKARLQFQLFAIAKHCDLFVFHTQPQLDQPVPLFLRENVRPFRLSAKVCVDETVEAEARVLVPIFKKENNNDN